MVVRCSEALLLLHAPPKKYKDAEKLIPSKMRCSTACMLPDSNVGEVIPMCPAPLFNPTLRGLFLFSMIFLLPLVYTRLNLNVVIGFNSAQKNIRQPVNFQSNSTVDSTKLNLT